ncbi:GLPGLI family protein [Winogradskyella flava]|uniref:GLPGLI family protein n=1 Tax=Winogradskyella flava TaxID=1884876 RepID=UPI0024939349|nr:GLPGLI family protein [Winogradskyella flava]
MRKRFYILLSSLFIVFTAYTQENSNDSGYIVYTVVPKMMNNHIYERTSDTAIINQYIRDYETKLTKYFRLSFNKKESFYESANTNSNNPQQVISKDGSVNGEVEFSGASKSEYYTNLETAKWLSYKGEYAVEKSIDTIKTSWNISEETKVILGFTCNKATKIQDINHRKKITGKDKVTTKVKSKTTVWFTTEMPAKLGPAQYNGFPGMVLEVENYAVKIIAEKISLNPDVVIDINKHKDKKIITSEEHKKIINNKYGLKN